MLVSVEAGEGLQRQIKVALPAAAVEQEIDKRLRDFARSARLPGFRPGKVPVKVLRQRFGDSVRGEVLAEQVRSSFPEAAAEADLRPAGVPEIEPDIDEAAGRYGYIARFEVLPQIALAPLGGQRVARPVAEVTDADLEQMIEHLREQRKRFAPVDRSAQSGDRVQVSFQGTIDNEPFDGGSAEDVSLELGSGRMIAGFEAQLEGASPGDERVVEVTFPDDYPTAALAGRPARFTVQVKTVSAPELPALDAAFVAEFGIADGDLERFRADVRGNMERELKQRIKARVKQQVMDALVQANPIEVPAGLVREELDTLKRQTGAAAGVSSGGFELPDELFADAARRRVALGLILAEVIRSHNLSASRERVIAAVEEVAATYEDPAAVVNFYLSDAKQMASVESLVLEDTVVEHLLGELEVVDEPSSFSALTQQAGFA